PRYGIEAIVLRRKLDGTPIVYAFQEMHGAIHAYDVADPLVLAPRRIDLRLRAAQDQTGAALLGPNLLVVSRSAATVTEYEFDADDGLRRSPRTASFGALTKALGLENPSPKLPVANVEGIAIDGRGDLFLLIDHNGQEIGVAGKNRARCGRLLWFRNRSKKKPRPEARRVRLKHIHIPFEGAKDAPKGIPLDKAGAAAIAREVMQRLGAGEDFGQIGAERHYTKSRYKATFSLVESTVRLKRGDLRRDNVPKALARLAFNLELGQAGVCEYHEVESPYGYHVLLRIE
ncbi:MAG: peptidylprolyl isomerase, partial [Planctomycetota bacterium]|nr:peptidylprolyl isomerase [Planctomycetota bacterium]